MLLKMDQSFPHEGAENKQSGQISIPKPEFKVILGGFPYFLTTIWRWPFPAGKVANEICPEQSLKPTAELGKTNPMNVSTNSIRILPPVGSKN